MSLSLAAPIEAVRCTKDVTISTRPRVKINPDTASRDTVLRDTALNTWLSATDTQPTRRAGPTPQQQAEEQRAEVSRGW